MVELPLVSWVVCTGAPFGPLGGEGSLAADFPTDRMGRSWVGLGGAAVFEVRKPLVTTTSWAGVEGPVLVATLADPLPDLTRIGSELVVVVMASFPSSAANIPPWLLRSGM